MDKIAKAIVAALIAAYGIYEFATTAESPGGLGVTSAEWARLVVFGLIAGITTWAVPNKIPPEGKEQSQEPVQEAAPAPVEPLEPLQPLGSSDDGVYRGPQ